MQLKMATSNNKTETKDRSKIDREIDEELNDLLNDALEDFSSGNEASGTPSTSVKSDTKATGNSGADPLSDMFTEAFSDEMAKHFEEAMKTLMVDDPHMLQKMEKLAEAAGSAGDSEASQKDFEGTLRDTLTSLAHNTEDLQDAAGADGGGDGPQMDAMMKMFEGVQMGGPDIGFMPMMHNMMKTLLSKEVLYPSLKDIADKYPDWLRENEKKVPESEYEKYSKQHSIIEEILREYEAEKSTDTDEVKSKRHERIMDKMQKMQDLGQPPKEIAGEMVPGLDFDPNSMPKFPGSSEACSIM